jgi:hypothetical protein
LPVRAKCCQSLHLMARTHLDQRTQWLSGTGVAVCPVTLCLYAQGSRWTIQTIAPAFDGLKVFPSRAGLSIARFGLSSFQACQPAGVSAHRVSALAPQSGGLRLIIDAEMSKYLSKKDRLNFGSTDYFLAIFSSSTRRAISSGAHQVPDHFKASRPTNI